MPTEDLSLVRARRYDGTSGPGTSLTASMTPPSTLRFVQDPPPETVRAIAAAHDENPFLTPEYVAHRRARGYRAWAVEATREGKLRGCFAFQRTGRWARFLLAPSTLALPEDDPGWEDLRRFGEDRRATRFTLGSYASPGGAVPTLAGEVRRQQRLEFVIRLEGWERRASLSSNHRRNVKKAEKRNMVLRVTSDDDAADVHCRMLSASFSRRRDRGEDVTRSVSPEEIRAFLGSGVGLLYQAVLDGTVAASALLLRAPAGAYYHSGGASPDGMGCGASHWLFTNACERLRDDGARVFNMGGVAPDDESLGRFKSHFGAEPRELTTVTIVYPDGIARKLGRLLSSR